MERLGGSFGCTVPVNGGLCLRCHDEDNSPHFDFAKYWGRIVHKKLDTYNNPKVSLVDLKATPILRMTETGIETAEGEQPFDIVVWATGFDFGTGALTRMGIRGRDGIALADHWADGPRTFLGVQSAGFPNLFFPGGPHAAAGNNPRYNGDQVDFITDLLTYARDHGHEIIEIDAATEAEWTEMVDTIAAKSPATFGENP